MKYPCITRNDNEIEMILFNEDTAIILNGIHKGKLHDVYPRFRSRYTNITREYLANTWGVVESKEHAEFIIELCKVNDIEVFNGFDIGITNFAIVKNEVIFTYGKPQVSEHDKQITIPLPPKIEPLKNAGDNLILGFEQNLKVARRVINELREEANCSDELLAKRDEWPQVGDEVIAYDIGFEREMTMIYRGKNKNNASIVEFENGNVILLGFEGKIKKPKTPEEALLDDVEHAIHHFEGDKVAGRKWLMSKYNITPKEV